MAYILCKRSNLLIRRCHPSIGYILHSDEHRKHDSIYKASLLQGISNFAQHRGFGFGSGFVNSSLGSLNRRCIDFSPSPSLGACLFRHMSTSNGVPLEKIEAAADLASVHSDTTVQAVAPLAPAVHEVAAAAVLPQLIHGIGWISIVLATLFTVRVLADATSKLTDMNADDGNKQMQMLLKEYGGSPFMSTKGLFIDGPIFICFVLLISIHAEILESLINQPPFECSTPPFYPSDEFKVFLFMPALKTLWIICQAVCCYWIMSNLFTVRSLLLLKVPAVGIPAGCGSQPPFSLSSMPKQFREAKEISLGESSSPVEAATKVSDQRILANAVMRQRIRSLEKQVKGRKRSSEKR